MLAPERHLSVNETETRYGKMYYLEGDTYIGHALEKYGEYSEEEPDLWRQFIDEGDVVLDIGANIGALTVALAQMVGDEGQVFAFEPQPENYTVLCLNAKNSDMVISTHRLALGDKDGEVTVPKLEALKHTNYGAIELDSITKAETRDDVCRVTTLDKVVQAGVGGPITFIKIDVEGMEAKVLRGAELTIKKHRPTLYVENDRKEKSEELIKLLHDYGYALYEHKPMLYAQDNFKHAEVEAPMISINILCVPHEHEDDYHQVTADMKRITPRPPKRATSSVKNWACVVRLGGIGDNLIAASTLRPLKEQGYMIEVISQGIQAAVFENNPFVDKLTLKSAKEVPQDNPVAWQKYWWSRSCEYAKFINLSHSVEVLMAQFPQSTAFWWPSEFRRKLCGQSYLEAAHDIVGVPYQFGPVFFPTQEEQEDIADFKARHKLDRKPLIAWVVSGTRIDKVYPFAALAISRLLSEIDCNVIMLSAPSPELPDAGRAEQIMNHVKLANSNVEGLYEARNVEGLHRWSIRRMLSLALQSDLVIGPDTGVMWAVAMENMPKIVLHSHASVQNITAHWNKTLSLHADSSKVPCWPCHLLHDERGSCEETQIKNGMKPTVDDVGAACIGDISVRQLLLAAKGALGDAGSLSQLRDEFGNTTVLR